MKYYPIFKEFEKPKKRKGRVTVCIAAIYNRNSILGISDRMLTAGSGDIEYEPPQEKIYSLTNSIAAMTAGDVNIQTQILLRITPFITEKIAACPPGEWVPVEDVAKYYRDTYIKLQSELAERQILFPLGLTRESFLKQESYSSDFVETIRDQLNRFSMERFYGQGIATIITGLDNTGSHIYTIRNGELSCEDILGFSCIGIGAGHANLHFMLSGYHRASSEPKALLTIHQAKKKSEVSPGVGKASDMFVIGRLGGFTILRPPTFPNDIVKDMDKFYEDYKKGITRLDLKTEAKIKDYLNASTQGNAPEQAVNPDATLPVSVETSDTQKGHGKAK